MDNQQAIENEHIGECKRIAGLYWGEGSFYITSNIQKGKRTYHGAITIGNTDAEMIVTIKNFLDSNGIGYRLSAYLHTHSTMKSKSANYNQWQLNIWKLQDMKKFLEIVLPYLGGIKKAQATLLLQFIHKCQSKVSKFTGSNWRGTRWTDEEREEIEHLRVQIRESPETTRLIPGDIGEHHVYADKGKDIVQLLAKA
jgi:hypothetical protein